MVWAANGIKIKGAACPPINDLWKSEGPKIRGYEAPF